MAYTDGITDWESAAGELVGSARLENALRTLCDFTPRQVVQRIITEVPAFAKGGSQRDDATLMVFRVDRDRMRRIGTPDSLMFKKRQLALEKFPFRASSNSSKSVVALS